MSLGVGVFVLPSVLKDMGLIAGLIAIAFFGIWVRKPHIATAIHAMPYHTMPYHAIPMPYHGSFYDTFLVIGCSFIQSAASNRDLRCVLYLGPDVPGTGVPSTS